MHLLRSETGRVTVSAHRGASGYAPENTLAAFRLARELGADMVEFDVHMTADDRLVVLHDDTLDRTTSGTGYVRDRTWDEIAKLDAGAWYAPEFAGPPTGTHYRDEHRPRIGDVHRSGRSGA